MVRIGILSDSHDNMRALERALTIFSEKKVDYVFHCGDFVAPFAVKKLLSFEKLIFAVFGNNDGEKRIIRTLFNQQTQKIAEHTLFAEINGKKIAMTHGHIEGLVDSLINSKKYDIVLSGHTHQKMQQTTDGVLHVNPGETCGWVTGTATIAIIDLTDLKTEFIEFEHV